MVIFPLCKRFQIPRKFFEISEVLDFGDGIINFGEKISGLRKFYSGEQEFGVPPQNFPANALGKYVHIQYSYQPKTMFLTPETTKFCHFFSPKFSGPKNIWPYM
jgi:hypothetical protein